MNCLKDLQISLKSFDTLGQTLFMFSFNFFVLKGVIKPVSLIKFSFYHKSDNQGNCNLGEAGRHPLCLTYIIFPLTHFEPSLNNGMVYYIEWKSNHFLL